MNRRNLLLGGSALLLANRSVGSAMSQSSSSLWVPPEEEPHQRTFMQWPVSRRVYPDAAFLREIQKTIARIANAIAEFEPVTMLAAKSDHARARRHLAQKVELWDVATEDLWCRDSGPLFARNQNGELVISHIRFNGWGNKQVHRRDGKIAARIAGLLDMPILASGVTGEAGGVEHDGHGLLMAHESSWLNRNRNPGMTRDQIEQRLLAAYGGKRMFWSPGVWGEDITDYHIDSLARFTGPGRVLMNLPEQPDRQDEFHQAALQTHDVLLAAGLEVDVIPEPDHRRVNSIDFVASYANFYVCNGGVIAAQFGDRNTDKLAVEALARHYPDREIVTLNVDALGEVGGGIHCATQQMPIA